MGGGGGEKNGQGAASSSAGLGTGPCYAAQGRHFSPVICKAVDEPIFSVGFYR